MNALAHTPNTAATAQPLTMSSKEIAELTGKTHKNVLADIREMLTALGKTSAEFSANLPDKYGRPQPVFNLPKDLSITLVVGYNVVMRHRIVVRWQELEAQVAQPVPDKNMAMLQFRRDLLAATQAQTAVLQQILAALQQDGAPSVFFARWLDVRFDMGCDMQRLRIFPR